MKQIAIVGSLVAALVVSAAATASGDAVREPTFRARDLLAGINAERAKRGVPALKSARSLVRAAEFHSREMATHGYFAHRSADGGTFAERIRRFYAPANGGRWRAGENILWGSSSLGAAEALRMWMRSTGHRANLLARGWVEVGISVVAADRAPGVFRGNAVTIVTADFGLRS